MTAMNVPGTFQKLCVNIWCNWFGTKKEKDHLCVLDLWVTRPMSFKTVWSSLTVRSSENMSSVPLASVGTLKGPRFSYTVYPAAFRTFYKTNEEMDYVGSHCPTVDCVSLNNRHDISFLMIRARCGMLVKPYTALCCLPPFALFTPAEVSVSHKKGYVACSI